MRCGATIFPDNVEAGELKVNCRGKVGFRYADNINVVTGNKKFQFCLVGSKTADVDLEYFSHLRCGMDDDEDAEDEEDVEDAADAEDEEDAPLPKGGGESLRFVVFLPLQLIS